MFGIDFDMDLMDEEIDYYYRINQVDEDIFDPRTSFENGRIIKEINDTYFKLIHLRQAKKMLKPYIIFVAIAYTAMLIIMDLRGDSWFSPLYIFIPLCIVECLTMYAGMKYLINRKIKATKKKLSSCRKIVSINTNGR